jgi:hypothetical protein
MNNTKISKKDIQNTIENSLNVAIERLHIAEPSKNIRKALKKATQRISAEVKSELKKINKKMAKQQKTSSKKKNQKAVRQEVELIESN